MPYPPGVDTGQPNSNLFLPSGWDIPWKSAKLNAGNQRAGVTFIGDSITWGWNASDFMATSWAARLRAAILTANSNLLGGDHFGIAYSAAIQAVNGGPTTATYPLTINGTKGSNWDTFYSAYNYQALGYTNLSPFITCTPPYAVTGFEIIYDDYVSGTWTYSIDAGSTTNVNTSGAGGAPDNGILRKVTISGLSSGAHTLKINSPSTATVCNIVGINAYTDTAGLCFANLGWPGFGLVAGNAANNNLSDTNGCPKDRLAMYQGPQGPTATPTALTGLGFPSQPDLAIISLGVNDGFQSVSKADFKNALQRLVWSLRYGKNDACSIMLVAQWMADGTIGTSSTFANTDFGSVYTAYRDIKTAMIEVAHEEECAFVDIHKLFGRKPIANGWITSTSDVHPTATGHQVIANLLSAIV
jgi:lysophospholipase L1-like esterase